MVLGSGENSCHERPTSRGAPRRLTPLLFAAGHPLKLYKLLQMRPTPLRAQQPEAEPAAAVCELSERDGKELDLATRDMFPQGTAATGRGKADGTCREQEQQQHTPKEPL